MIEISNLSKSYGSKKVLEDLSFVAEDGYITGFVGPNGAGKSTTMRIVACLEDADGGSCLVDGAPFSQAASPASVMGVYLGNDYLPMHMTGAGYLRYVCKVSGIDESQVQQLLQMVELEEAGDKYIKSYSLGMKQRVGLAAAIAGNPTTLMLDEPVNGLDPMGVQWLRNLMRNQADAGKAVLLSSHLLAELELVADRVVMLDQGHVVAQGDMAQLSKGEHARISIRTSNDQQFEALLQQRGLDVVHDSNGLLVAGMSARELGKLAFESGLLVDHLTEARMSLENVFMEQAVQDAQGGDSLE